MNLRTVGRAAITAAAIIPLALPPAFAQSDTRTEAQKALAGEQVRFLQPSMPQFAALGKFIPEFEEKFGIKVIVDEIPFDQYRQKSLVEMQQGTGAYDLYAVDVMWLAEYAAAGFLEPLMPYVRNADLTDPGYDIDDFLPRVISGTGVFNDTLYTIPLGAGPVGTTFRSDLAEQAGFKLPERFSPEFTTDYMFEAAKKVHNPEAGVIGFANIPGRWFWGVTWLPYLYAFQTPETVGNEYLDENWKVTINNENTVAAIDYFVKTKEFMPADSANWGIGEATAVYQQGGAFGTWNYQDFIKGFFEDPATQATVAGKNVHLHTPAGPHGVLDPWFGAWSFGLSKELEAQGSRLDLRAVDHLEGDPGTRHRVRRRAVAAFDLQVGNAGQVPAVVGAGLRVHADADQPGRARAHPGMGRDLGHHGAGRQPRLDRRDRCLNRRGEHGKGDGRGHEARRLLHPRQEGPAAAALA